MIIELENPFEVFLFPLLKLPSHHHHFVLLAISLVPYDDDDVRLLVFCRIIDNEAQAHFTFDI